MSTIALTHPSRPRVATSGFGARKLTRRGRLARLAMVLSLSIVLGAGFAMKASGGDSVGAVDGTATYFTIVVAPGESLWSIAADAAAGQAGIDVRQLVDEIVSANSLTVPDVKAGQVLRIPV
ncbi:MAG: LysM peptidoglycan-binding domain-containing protein [Streptomycetaceae bacterium]|nr:MAG: LysM peptidoglycan-binding domain-containing protein [Streptomycetaceae bacterium]